MQLYKLYFTFDVFCLFESNIVKLELQLHMKKLIFKDRGVTELSLYHQVMAGESELLICEFRSSILLLIIMNLIKYTLYFFLSYM